MSKNRNQKISKEELERQIWGEAKKDKTPAIIRVLLDVGNWLEHCWKRVRRSKSD